MKKLSKKVIIDHIKKQVENLDKFGVVAIPLYIDSYDQGENEVYQEILRYKEDILKIRGIHQLEVAKGAWTNTIFIYAKPCKEFIKVQKYLEKYYGYTLNEDTIRYDRVSGKRSSVDIEDRRMLMHFPKRCEKLLEKLKDQKPTVSTYAKVVRCDERDDADRYNGDGEDRENEWDGYYSYGIEISVRSRRTDKPKWIEKIILR